MTIKAPARLLGAGALLALAALAVWGPGARGIPARQAALEGTPTLIAAPEAALLAGVPVAEGASVRRGQLLARLDPALAEEALSLAEAKLAERRTEAASAERLVGALAERAARDVALAGASAKHLALVARNAGRAARFSEDEAARVRQAVETATDTPLALRLSREKAALAAAQEAERLAAAAAGSEALTRTRAAVRVELRSAEGAARTARARVRSALAEVEAARARLARTRVLAPGDAVVIHQLAQVGETLRPAQPILALWQPGRLWVRAGFDQAALPRLRAGASARMRLAAYPGRVWTGRVSAVGTAVLPTGAASSAPAFGAPDAAPALVEVRIELDRADPSWRPGLAAQVEVDPS